MSDIDSIALKISRRIMLDIRTDTIPVDVRKIGQLQAKIQCVLEEYIREQQAEITRLNAIIKENEADAKRYRFMRDKYIAQALTDLVNPISSNEAMRMKGE